MVDNNQNDGLVEYVLEQMLYNETWLSVVLVIDSAMVYRWLITSLVLISFNYWGSNQ